MKKGELIADVKKALDVALFKKKVMHQIAGSTKSNKCALMILAAGAVLGGVGMQIFSPFSPNLWMSFGMVVYEIVFAIIGIYILSAVSVQVFKGSAKHDALFRVIGFGMIVTWLNIFPPLGIIAGLWGIALIFVILKEVHKLTTGGAIGAMLVSLIAFALIGMILTPVLSRLGIYDGGFNNKTVRMRGYGDELEMNFRTEDGEGTMEMEIPNFR